MSAVGAARLASTQPTSAFLTQAEPLQGQIRHTSTAAMKTRPGISKPTNGP